MPQDPSPRPARAQDVTGLVDLLGQLGYPTTEAECAVSLARRSERADEAILVVEEEGTVVGLLHVMETPRLTGPRRGEIVALVVDSRIRRCGLGRRLVEAAASWGRERGLSTLRVRTNVRRETAPKFYVDLGFEPVKQQRVFALDLEP